MKDNLLKKILMIGFTAIISGIVLMSSQVSGQVVDSATIGNLLIWVVILLLSVVAATVEDVTTELKEVAHHQVEELRLMKAEIVLMRHEISSKRK